MCCDSRLPWLSYSRESFHLAVLKVTGHSTQNTAGTKNTVTPVHLATLKNGRHAPQSCVRLCVQKSPGYSGVLHQGKLTATLCNFDCNPWLQKTKLNAVCSLLFTEAVPSNDPLLQLLLQSAGSLHASFRNLHELQSWGRAVIGHQRENQQTFSP